jgi:hypothetical protein
MVNDVSSSGGCKVYRRRAVTLVNAEQKMIPSAIFESEPPARQRLGRVPRNRQNRLDHLTPDRATGRATERPTPASLRARLCPVSRCASGWAERPVSGSPYQGERPLWIREATFPRIPGDGGEAPKPDLRAGTV